MEHGDDDPGCQGCRLHSLGSHNSAWGILDDVANGGRKVAVFDNSRIVGLRQQCKLRTVINAFAPGTPIRRALFLLQPG